MSKKSTSMGFRCSEDLKRILEIISALEGINTTEFIVDCLNSKVKNYLKENPDVIEILNKKGVKV